MDQYENMEARKKLYTSTKLSSSVPDIDQLCQLIDENTFGLQSFPSSKFHSVPVSQVKAFRSSRLKRLHKKSNTHDNENLSLTHRTFSMRFSLSSSFLTRFRSLSTSRRYSSPSITLFHTKSIQPSVNEDDAHSSSTTQSQLSCTVVDERRTTANSCSVEELAAYLDDFLYLPKSLSGAAELMYT